MKPPNGRMVLSAREESRALGLRQPGSRGPGLVEEIVVGNHDSSCRLSSGAGHIRPLWLDSQDPVTGSAFVAASGTFQPWNFDAQTPGTPNRSCASGTMPEPA